MVSSWFRGLHPVKLRDMRAMLFHECIHPEFRYSKVNSVGRKKRADSSIGSTAE